VDDAEPIKAACRKERKKSAEQHHREQTVKRSIKLSRVRIATTLANATNPNHKKVLQAASSPRQKKKIAEFS